MPSEVEELLNKITNGSVEEKFAAVIAAAKCKDPAVRESLRSVADASSDPHLSFAARYALAMTGDGEAISFLNSLTSGDGSSLKTIFPHISGIENMPEEHLGDNIFDIPQEIMSAHRLLETQVVRESKERLIGLISLAEQARNYDFIDGIPGAEFYRYGIERTRGLLLLCLGMAELHLGNMDESLRLSHEVLTLGKDLEDGQLVTIALCNLGVAHMEMDKYFHSLEYFHKSLDMMDEHIDPWRKKNRVLYNISTLYYRIGNAAESGKYAEMALEAVKEENDPIGTSWCLNACGINLFLDGDNETAEGLFLDALDCCKASGDRQAHATALTNIAFIHQRRGEYDKAIEIMDQALGIFRDTENKRDTASTLVNLAHLYMEAQRIEEGYSHALEALKVARETVGLRDDAEACYILGTIEHYCNNDCGKAYGYYKEAIELFENIRRDAALDEFKISLAENSANSYAQMISLCLETDRVSEAFEYVERSKSRALIDLLSKAVDGIEPRILSKSKMEEIASLKERLSWLRNNLNQLYRSAGVIETDRREGRSVGKNELDATYNGIRESELRYMEAYQEVKRIDPEWASISKVEPFSMDETAELLDEETALVEYYQTSDRLYIFVISKDRGILTFQVEMNAGGEFERLLLLLQRLGGDTVLDVRSHAFLKDTRLTLSHFYRLLISPLEESIEDVKRLIIVPHLFWHHLPFHALYDEERREYLTDRFEISYAPSAEVLKHCRMKNDPERRTAAVFANPTGDLPFADEEAWKIASCFGENVTLFSGKEATLNNLESLEDTDIIHLACHGVFRADEPVFSHLLLADDDTGRGACFLPNIFNLRLKTPTLVAISACESGLNIPSSGDDLIGFARGFFYAGAPSIVASLWRVNDKSTASFMEEFYKGLIYENLSKSKALQLAIKKIKSKEEYSHPYFWAPFVLMGDWK